MKGRIGTEVGKLPIAGAVRRGDKCAGATTTTALSCCGTVPAARSNGSPVDVSGVHQIDLECEARLC